MRVLAVVVLLVLGGYQGAVTWQYVEQARWPENVVDPGFHVGRPWPTVRGVTGRAAEAGLRDGDRLVEVHGKPYENERERARVIDKLFPGDRIRVTVSGGRELTWQLEEATSRWRWVRLAAAILLPWVCLGVGFAGVWRGGNWLRLGILVSASHWVAPPVFFGPVGWGAAVCYEAHVAARGLLSVFLFQEGWRRWRWTAALGLTMAPMLAVSAMANWGEAARWAGWIDGLGAVAEATEWGRMGAAVCALIYRKGLR